MKTLIEVIFEAPYTMTPWEKNALYYLKEYRDHMINENIELQEEVKKQKERIEFLEKPLTWDELKMLFHKPVWIETSSKKGWNIIVSIDNTDMQVIHTAHRGPKLSGFTRSELCKTWNAYRKERG